MTLTAVIILQVFTLGIFALALFFALKWQEGRFRERNNNWRRAMLARFARIVDETAKQDEKIAAVILRVDTIEQKARKDGMSIPLPASIFQGMENRYVQEAKNLKEVFVNNERAGGPDDTQ